MSENRLPDYLDHMQQAAADACSFVEGLAKDDFLEDKRTQQAVIMSLIIIGEAATKVMERYAGKQSSRLAEPRAGCFPCPPEGPGPGGSPGGRGALSASVGDLQGFPNRP